MADKLKVFKNETLSIADLVVDEFVLLANDSVTQAVVKDVYSSSTVAMDLMNGVSVLGETNSTLTGAETIDTDSKLVFKLRNGDPSTLVGVTSLVERFILYSSGSGLKNYIDKSEGGYPTVFTPVMGETLTSVGIPTNMSGSIIFYYINAAGTHFYGTHDGNSSAQLFRAASGATSWTNISNTAFSGHTSYWPLAYDDGVVYSATSNRLLSFDLETEVSVGTVGTFATTVAGASYPHLAVSNGYAFAGYDGTGTTLYYLDLNNTDNKGYLSNMHITSNRRFNVHHYNGTWSMMYTVGGVLTTYVLPYTLTTGNPNIGSLKTTWQNDGVLSQTTNQPQGISGTSDILILSVGGELMTLNAITGDVAASQDVGVNSTTVLNVHSKQIVSNINQFDISLDVKVSGIEVTGVL
jgi:hypothetical protein